MAQKHNLSKKDELEVGFVEETEELISPKSFRDEHEKKKVKSGGPKQEKRAAKRMSGLPKKSGQGGKYTWNGPIDEASPDESSPALDEKDPNYVDEDEPMAVSNSPLPKKVIVV